MAAPTLPDSGYVNVNDDEIGLDRANILPHNQIKLARDDQVPSVSNNPATNAIVEDAEHATDLSKRDKIKGKLKKALHIHNADDEVPKTQDVHGNTHEIPNPVLAPSGTEKSGSRYVHELPKHEKTTMKDVIHNPVETVKEKVQGQGSHQTAATIAAKETPHGKDVDLVRAHERVDVAQTEAEKLLAIKDLDKLIKERQNMFVRWTIDRHITKLRRLPKESFPKKTIKDFEKMDPIEGKVMDWRAYWQHQIQYFSQHYGGQYIGYGSVPPEPSKESLMPSVERLLIASSPIQEFIMTARRVYRWETPSETAKYLAIYLTLWYFNLLLPGALCFFIYLVAERRIHGKSIEDLREDIIRTENTNKTAFSITELIEKRGDENWADEIIERMGPWAMVQLSDAANALEVMRNFYEWRKPYRTGSTLALMAFGVIATLFTPLWLLVKVSTFGMGFAFFGLWPIAVNFPEYRLLVSPMKRIFWNIPTHAEWAIMALQAKGTRYEQEHPDLIETDLKPYKAHFQHTTGHLVISPHALHFQTKTGGDQFAIRYSQIEKLEKVDRIVSKNLPKPEPIKDSGKDLRIVTVDVNGGQGKEYVLNNVDMRDEVFSQIVGFSDTEWQVVW